MSETSRNEKKLLKIETKVNNQDIRSVLNQHNPLPVKSKTPLISSKDTSKQSINGKGRQTQSKSPDPLKQATQKHGKRMNSLEDIQSQQQDISQDFRKLEGQSTNRLGLVTAYGRQLSTNEELQLKLATDSKNSSPLIFTNQLRGDNKKNTFKEGSEIKSSIAMGLGLRAQNTIPLNFFEDLKIGIDIDESKFVNGEAQDQPEPEKWFQDANFSVIYKNPTTVDKNAINQDNFSLPSYSDRSRQSKNMKKRIEFPNFDDNEAQSPLANVYFNFDDEDNGLDYRKSNDAYTEEVMSQQKDRETNLNIETGNDAPGIQSTNINYEYYTKNMDSEGDFLKPQNTHHLKRLKEVDLHNKSAEYMKKLEMNFQAGLHNLKENDNDISQIEKNFEIDFAQKLSLDERRAKMYIINNLMAATNQGQVKDDSFFMIVDKDALERIDDMRGRCLLPRKMVMKIKTHTTHLAAFIITSKVFDAITLFVILLNSIQLATDDPTTSSQPSFLSVLDNVFMGFYTTEMTLKIIGMGFILNKGAYLRDPWNVLDFTIVSTGLLSLVLSGSKLNLSGMRSFRVLRPLKTITNIEGLKKLVVALLSSVSQLRDSFIVLYFFYLIFSIAGLQFFSGIFKKQCINIESGTVDPSGNICGARACDAGQMCGKTNSNPYYEQSNFDTIFYSFITVFECVSLEGWTYVMKFAQKAYVQQAWFYFCPLTFIIAYFLLQFTQAVISNSFEKQHQKEDETKTVKKKKRKLVGDFENLDDKEREKLLKSQEEARKNVLYKWRMIFFIKQEMRILLKKYLERKRTEKIAKLTASGTQKMNPNIGFKNFITHKFPKEGKQNQNRETMMEESASARFLLNERQNKDSNRIFDNQQIISVEDEFETKKTYHTFKKPNLQIAKSKNFNKIANCEFVDPDKLGTTKNKVKNWGIQGIKENKDLKLYRLKKMQEQTQQQDGNFFEQFVSKEIIFLEQQFSENQLREMVLHLDGEKFLQEIERNPQDLDYGDLSQLSIEYDRKIRESKIRQKDGQEWESNIVSDDESIYGGRDQTQLFSQTLQNQIVIDNQTTIKQDSTLADQKQSESDKNGSSKDKEISENLSNKLVTDQSQNSKVRKSRTKQAIMSKLDSSPNQVQATFEPAKTSDLDLMKSDTQKTNDMLSNVSPLKKPKPLKMKSRFDGTNTIHHRDFISYEDSVFNNKSFVQEDVGKHKKIYIRKDKLDFQKQIDDIFEQREKLKKEVLLEQAQKESVDYLANIKVKPYCKKCHLDPKPINLTEEQQDVLQTLQLDSTDLEREIQRQYSKQFISELYVTGTLSITLAKKKEERKVALRKIQGQGVFQEENENVVMIQMVKQQLNFMNLSCSLGSMGFQSDKSSQNGTSNIESSLGSRSQISRSGINSVSTLKSKKTMIVGPGGFKRQIKSNGLTINEGSEKAANARKERILIKQAAKDANFQKKLTIKRINKDAIRSKLFKESVLKRKNALNKSGDDIKDSDDEDEKEKEEDDEDDIDDDFHDLEFNNNVEILRSKKSSLQEKVSSVQWSGQDVLENYDPKEADIARETIQKIRIWRKGGLGYWKRVQWTAKTFIMGSVLDYFLTFCVSFNTVCLALDRYGIDPTTESFLTWANKVFTYIFISEMACKLIGLGPLKYMKDKMNYLDGTIVLLSIVEQILAGGGGAISAFRSIRIFRIFRVLRITRLLRAMKTMSVILNALVNSLSALMYLYMLVFLSIFIFSLLGMQIFGGNMNYDDNADGYPGVPRQNYDTFMWSFQVCFQLLTQENWQIILYDTLRSPVNRGLTMIYHIAWMTVGNTILLNLLMGIMLDSMKEEDDNVEKDFNKMKKKHVEDMRKKEGQALIDHFLINQIQINRKSSALGKKKKKKQKKDDNVLDESFEFDPDIFTQKVNFNFTKKKKKDFEGNYCELSYYLFTKRNPFRHFLYKLSNHFMFEVFIQCLILFSSIKLIVDGYTKNYPADSTFMIFSGGLDYFFTAAFACESLIKSLSLGFVMDKGTYLRETWSQLDFFIVVTALIDASFSSVNIPFIKILRLLRTLRPLRVISHNSEMKTIIVALIHSVSGIMYVGVLLLLVWVMFAILGVTLIGGKLYSCTVDPYLHFTEAECTSAQGQWTNFPFNYDNVGIALISLFDVATMENWPDQRNAAMDISGQGTGPIRNNSQIYAFYFMIFILIGTYIFLNLFIGVIFLKFGDAQKEEIESTHLNEDQLKWVDMVKMIVNAKPDLETTNIPLNPYRKQIHELVTGAPYLQKPDQDKKVNKFEIAIMSCIVLNMFSMCVTFEGESNTVVSITNYINYFFTAVFIFEAVCKLIAFGLTYFQSSWNLFDCFVVTASILDIMLSQLNMKTSSFLKIGPQLARIMRVLRISRLFRLIKKYKGLNALMQTIQFSLPALMNVFALLMLVYFIFGILANFMFGDVTTGMIIDEYTNFNTFGTSMLTLIRASTGEDWNYIMYDCGHTQYDNCIPGQTCGSAYNQFFFLAFETIQGFIMLNLFILVTIQQFEKYYLQTNNVLQHFKDNLALFKDMWTYFTIADKCEKIKGQHVVRFFYEFGLLIQLKQYKNTTLVKYFHEVSNRKINRPDDYLKIKEKKEERRKLEEQKKLDELKRIEEEKLGIIREKVAEKDEGKEKGESKKKSMDSNARDQITKDIVRMDLEADGEGYVYFNELLFKTMKMVFGEQHLKNTILVDAEYKALKKIQQIKEKFLKKQRATARIQAMTVNPFVLKMFKHISFKSWLKAYKQNIDKRAKQKAEKGEVDVSDAEIEEVIVKKTATLNNQENGSDEEYFYETEKDESCDDEESEAKDASSQGRILDSEENNESDSQISGSRDESDINSSDMPQKRYNDQA